jgi:large subunit ribosomal protein L1
MKRSKRYRSNIEQRLDADRETYSLEEAIKALKSFQTSKFDETAEIVIRLGVDSRHADQMVRGTVVLPHGTGVSRRVLVLTKGDKEKEATEAGADLVGGEEMIEKIAGGWMDFDAIIATPDMMGQVGKLGRVLGPRGLMPNPKSGTVTQEIDQAVREIKAGKIEYRVDRGGNVQGPIGKASFSEEQLLENAKKFIEVIIKARPAVAKGQYLKGIYISTTMSPGIKVDHRAVS